MKSWEEELEMVEAASQSAYGLQQLAAYLRPYLHGFAYAYLSQRDDVTDKELVEVALIPLDRAVRLFIRHDRHTKGEYPFRFYYNWWARQAMLTYLRDNKSTRSITRRKNEED